ncbi:MAG TPA: hypothetical protein VKZ63_21250, partial [Kofleriaceae bacterium]|nr:hypothetical protein [Kofleriaceae bacterium]
MRNALYEASRLAEQGTPLDLEARQEEDRVVFAIRYVPLPWHDHASALYSEYDDVGIARGVASAVAEAHGGSMGEEVDGSRAVLWLELPAEPEPPARPAA